MENKKALLLLSGGIDSTTLLAKLASENYEITALSFYYGQKHSIELDFAKENAEKYKVKEHKIIEIDSQIMSTSALVSNEIQITTYQNTNLPAGKVNVYVPFRNMIFISMALSMAQSKSISKIYLAVNKDDSHNFWDCKSDFINCLNQITTLDSDIKILTPFINFSKGEVIKIAKYLNINLDNTITCYQPIGKVECGKCLSCVTKQKALAE